MKKLTYLVIATAALGMVACTGNKAGYVITGTVEGAADGDTVYLQEATGRNLTKLDTAVISKGTFTFEATQDAIVTRINTSACNPKLQIPKIDAGSKEITTNAMIFWVSILSLTCGEDVTFNKSLTRFTPS